jgi:hypothetical protein
MLDVELIAALAAGTAILHAFGTQWPVFVAILGGSAISLYLTQHELLSTEQRLAIPFFAALIYSDVRFHRVSTMIVVALALLSLLAAPMGLGWFAAGVGVALAVRLVVPKIPVADLAAIAAAVALFSLVGCVAVFVTVAVAAAARMTVRGGSTLPRIAALQREIFAPTTPVAGIVALALLALNIVVTLRAYPLNNPALVWIV